MKFWIIIIIGILAISECRAQDTDEGIEIDGLIINQCITRIGNDFYDSFYSKWNPPENLKKYNIIISEKPLPNIGSIIQINVEESKIFEQLLKPRASMIETAAQSATGRLKSYLQNYEETKKQIGGDDMEGDGIH